jgi:hypothetical protein
LFAFNLISLPQLDQKGFYGTWGSGVLSVFKDGKLVVEGRLAFQTPTRLLYKVDVTFSLLQLQQVTLYQN